MHRPDPKRSPNMQDKRSVIPIAIEDVDAWLATPVEHAEPLIRLAPSGVFEGEPAAP